MSGPHAVIPRAENDGVPIDTELEQALLLVRVSTMKMLRLQLAIERRDRAVALQAVDDLMELDAWMARSAGHDVDADLLDAIAREVDDERGALLHEKFGLAAGMVKRAPPHWVEPETLEPAEADAEAYDFLGPVEAVIEEEPAARRRGWLLLAALMLVVVAATVVAAVLLGWLPDEWSAQLISLGGPS